MGDKRLLSHPMSEQVSRGFSLLASACLLPANVAVAGGHAAAFLSAPSYLSPAGGGGEVCDLFLSLPSAQSNRY